MNTGVKRAEVHQGPNRFHLLRQLRHAELVVFFELNRRRALTGQSTVKISTPNLAAVCKLTVRSVYTTLNSLKNRRLIRVEDTWPRQFTLLYDLVVQLRPEERSLRGPMPTMELHEDPNRFRLLRELLHSEFEVLFELNRQIAVTGAPTVQITIEKLSEITKSSTRSVSNALITLERRKLIKANNTRPKSIAVLYDFTLKLRPEERFAE